MLRKYIEEIFHAMYAKSCAKKDIEALKIKVEGLNKAVFELENPPKKLTKREIAQKIAEAELALVELNLKTARRQQDYAVKVPGGRWPVV